MSGPRPKGPRLWLQPERPNKNGSIEASVWLIRDDGGFKKSTGCAPDDREEAERQLAEYIAEKYQPAQRHGDPAVVLTIDLLNLYLSDVVPGHSRPSEAKARILRLSSFWGDPDTMRATLRLMKRGGEAVTGHASDVRAITCKAYVKFVGKDSAARRDLEDLRAAINHAFKETVIDRPVPVTLPEKADPRERWLTREEAAKLVWTAWRARRRNGKTGEMDDYGQWKHVARFILMSLYTGTRKSATLKAAFTKMTGAGFIDLEAGLWYRRAEGQRRTKKRQPPVPLPDPLLGHMRRWKANGQAYAVEFHGESVDRIDKAFRALVKEAGLGPDVVPHVLRHTAITWAMQRGMDIWDASGYFGVSVEVLTQVYGHHHPDHLRAAANKMARPLPHRQSSDRVNGTNRDSSVSMIPENQQKSVQIG